MIGIDEELKATEAAKIVLSATNPNSEATIRVLRQAKYVAAVMVVVVGSCGFCISRAQRRACLTAHDCRE